MRSQRPILVRAVALLVGLLFLAGCSNPFASDDPPQVAAADRSGRELTQVETRTALPPEASLPEGWSTATKNLLRPQQGNTRVRQARCRYLANGIDAGWLDAATKSYATYVHPAGSTALLGIGIGSHPDEAPVLSRLKSTLRACPVFNIVDGNGRASRVQAQPLKLAYIAEDTLTYRTVLVSRGEVMVWDVVRVRVGHNIVQGDLVTAKGRPNTEPLVTAVKNALLNLS